MRKHGPARDSDDMIPLSQNSTDSGCYNYGFELWYFEMSGGKKAHDFFFPVICFNCKQHMEYLEHLEQNLEQPVC